MKKDSKSVTAPHHFLAASKEPPGKNFSSFDGSRCQLGEPVNHVSCRQTEARHCIISAINAVCLLRRGRVLSSQTQEASRGMKAPPTAKMLGTVVADSALQTMRPLAPTRTPTASKSAQKGMQET